MIVFYQKPGIETDSTGYMTRAGCGMSEQAASTQMAGVVKAQKIVALSRLQVVATEIIEGKRGGMI